MARLFDELRLAESDFGGQFGAGTCDRLCDIDALGEGELDDVRRQLFEFGELGIRMGSVAHELQPDRPAGVRQSKLTAPRRLDVSPPERYRNQQ